MNNPFEALELKLISIESLLKQYLPLKSELSPPSDPILTVKEAAIFLGLSVPTIYTLISQGQLPVMKRTKKCYFYESGLRKYLEQGRIKTSSEIASENDAYLINQQKKRENGKYKK